MIVTRTPYRISFIGGGSDLPVFYKKSPGTVISTAINKYVYISIHPSFNPAITTVRCGEVEVANKVEEISHPIVKAALKKLGVQGVEITSVSDIPAQTGLGSSSSFTVGLLQGLYAYLGKERTHEELAQEACEIEIGILRAPIGKQDQYAAAYGGLNQYKFKSDNTVEAEAIKMSRKSLEELESSLLLFFTGITRSASKVLSEQSENLISNENKTKALQSMLDMIPSLRSELQKGNIDCLGEYLDRGWQIKRSLAKSISNAEIDEIYSRARKLGAQGGKLLGAGGGGFFLFYCHKDSQKNLIDNLGLRYMNVKFDQQGAKVVFSS